MSVQLPEESAMTTFMSCRNNPQCDFGKSHVYTEVFGTYLSPSKKSDLLIVYDTLKLKQIPFFGNHTRSIYDLMHKYLDFPFLDSLLEDSGINDAYLTSCVKCIPNTKIFRKKPTVSNIKKCGEVHFKRELETLNPKVILLVGTESLKLFNITGKLSNIQGDIYEMKYPKWEDGPTFKVIPVMNPSVLIHNNSNKLYQTILRCFKLAKELSEGKESNVGLDHSKVTYTLLDTPEKLEAFVEEIKDIEALAFDTETFDLSVKSPVLCYSFSYGKDKRFILPVLKNNNDIENPQFTEVFDPTYLKYMLEQILKTDTPKIGHNIKYDYNVTINKFGVKPTGLFIDTMILHHLINEHPPHDLEFLLNIEFGYGNYSKELTDIVGIGTKKKRHYGHIPNEILWKYSALDAEGAWRLAMERYLPYVQSPQKKNLWKFYLEESEPLIRALAKPERYGHKVDTKILLELKKEYDEKSDDLLSKLKADSFPEFNPNSNPDRVKAFHMMLESEQDKMKRILIHNTLRTESGGISTSRDRLLMVLEKEEVPFIRNLIEYRNYKKLLGTYIDKILEMKDDRDFIQLNWNIIGTKTGRLSCSLGHQIPKSDKERWKQGKPVLRQAFIAPKGYKYIYADASQVELRVFAAVTKDQRLLKAFREGKDLHKITTAIFLGIREDEVTDFNRVEIGKRLNFGLIYGSQGHQIVHQGKWMDKDGTLKPITYEMFDNGLAKWKAYFKEAGNFFDAVELEAKLNNGTIFTVFGRERHFKGVISEFKPSSLEYKKALREMVNTKIQSAAASLTNRTIVKIDRILEDKISKGLLKENDILLANTVHDSLGYICREHLVDWFVKVLKTITSKPVPELANMVFPFDIGIGDSWAEAEYASK